MSVQSLHHCTQKTVVGLAIALLFASLAGTGYAFLVTPAQSSPPSSWVWIANIDALPDDGTPVRVSVATPERDAWTRLPDRLLGSVFLRYVPETDEVVALHSMTRYGCTLEYDKELRLFHERRCWNFQFDMDGKCVGPHPHSDLLKLDVRIRDGKVYINWELPIRGD